MNFTLSTIPFFDLWNTTTAVTVDNFVNVYRFSRAADFYAPYSTAIVLALPIVLLGLWALRENGIPADDGGFTQLIIASAGSTSLVKKAAASCLGGKKVSPELMNLRIRYGELVDAAGNDRSGTRRTGFGTLQETVPLEKVARYGS